MSIQSTHLPDVSDRESRLLAPYAVFSRDSRGRRHPEPPHPYRTPFQRDRDRIVHSAAFRRLSGKMQVFTGDRGDYHRTRLTHTQEVASIARTIGRALRLNEDLIEALALFHDIGHPPYGHAGEDALDACLKSEGGFSHNRYALTLAEELETRYLSFPGLNLSLEVLEGQAKRIHKTASGVSRENASLEVQVVDLADSITYDAHDTDDAVKLGLVSLDELRHLPLIRELRDRIQQLYGTLPPKSQRKALVHELIDRQVSDLLQHAAAELARLDFPSAADVRQAGFRLQPSRELADQKRDLERFLYKRVYRHPDLVRVRDMAQRRLQDMFEYFLSHPDQLPDKFRRRQRDAADGRPIGEYLAGMTDRYCDQRYAELLRPSGVD